jgi:hypothetical protein
MKKTLSVSMNMLGRKISEETRQKMRETMTGRKMPQWFKEKIKEGWRLRKLKLQNNEAFSGN